MVRENRYSYNNHNNTSSRNRRNGDGGGDDEMMMMMSSKSMKPAWLEGLMAETFFGGCGVHENSRKNEKNVFCLLCCLSICPHCLPSHRTHPLLQVRRYVYHDVIRLGDLEKLIDCSYIQVNHMVDQGDDLSAILYRIDESDFAFSQFEGLRMDSSEIIDDDGQITPSSIYENPSQHRGSSCSSEPEVLGKKKKKSGFLSGNFFSLSSRRKGSPHRAPLS
ncbi:hypothetical protein SADUNF_Sadunf03G0049800 [Salix dunnii]|uniref:B box-type domain-containing protein n=1 Tax=Salix dunnii TaxID=1413687 RepID=A0A835KDF3_9ROSI|nr:hypothetical protein SADUNF_Sadunf03G0049800 [Salix dunnii]